MEDLIIPLYGLAVLFFGVSLAYSTVGLGGGSSYTALMAILGVSHAVIPTTTLTLNLLVTFVGSVNFIRQRHARARLILPFLATSIPMSYLGGSLDVPPAIFYWILLVSLIFVALRIYAWSDTALRFKLGRTEQIVLSLSAGSALGLVAGIVGIGGGVYLVPLIIILGLGSEKEAAACGAIFIWVNSLSGLVARFQYHTIDVVELLPLMLAVLLGGTLGSHMGSSKLSARTMERLLGAIVLVAIVFLVEKIIFPN